MFNDPLTHLHLHRLTVDDAVARHRHVVDHSPRRRRPLRHLWASLRRRQIPRSTAAPARSVAVIADGGTAASPCLDTARSTPQAA